MVQDADTGDITEDTTELLMYGYEMSNTKLHMEEQWVRSVFTVTCYSLH